MAVQAVIPTFAVGDRVDSVYGFEHRGTVTEVSQFPDGGTYYWVKRDSDGFVFFALPFGLLPLPTAS